MGLSCCSCTRVGAPESAGGSVSSAYIPNGSAGGDVSVDHAGRDATVGAATLGSLAPTPQSSMGDMAGTDAAHDATVPAVAMLPPAATLAGTSSGFTPGHGGSGQGVRDAAAAQANQDVIKRVLANLQTPEQMRAAGYTQNPKNPDHWHNYSYKDPTDLAHPASLVVRGGRTVGVMIASPYGQVMPDFGAGGWHAHSSDKYNQLHIWADKPLASAYGTSSDGAEPVF